MRKLCSLCIVALCVTLFALTVGATDTTALETTVPLETETEPVATDTDVVTTQSPGVEILYILLDKWNAADPVMEITFVNQYECYAEFEPWVDKEEGRFGFDLVIEPDFGMEVYDDPETPYVDGIRMNGEPMEDSHVELTYLEPQDFIVQIKLVYKDNLIGDLAKLRNGDATIGDLIANPVIILQGLYYVISVISILVSAIVCAASKKRRVKNVDDVYEAVQNVSKQELESIKTECMNMVLETLRPVLADIKTANTAVVKAITLSTSKNPNAPVALLDLLKEVSDTDYVKSIENAKTAYTEFLSQEAERKKLNEQALASIANGTAQQEVQNVGTEAQTPEGPETPEGPAIF